MSATLIALGCAAVAGAVYVGVPRLVLNRHKRRLLERCRRQRVIVVTFDDGPGRLLTPIICNRLQETGLLATFFLLGSNVKGNEDLVELIRSSGHEIGSHGEEHVHHLWSWPWAGILDTKSAWNRLRDLLGADATRMPFRPPYGKMNLLSWLWIVWHRTAVMLWTHDSFDTRLGTDKSPQQLVDELRRDGGGVVLLHDFDRSVANAGKQVLAKLDAVLALRSEGFEFCRAGQLLES
ncbi:MAG: polysaccharide deacetylase family protein [Planctomycetes bacterium]|nr:polysaccharide deacetylase family protein [Planctomycetota bacterium]